MIARSRAFALLATAAILSTTNLHAQDRTEPAIAHLARVQVMLVPGMTRRAPHVANRWHTGRVSGGIVCIFIVPDSIMPRDLFPDLSERPMPALALSPRDILRLRVSTRYDGRYVPVGPSRVYEPGASLDGEEWREESVQRTSISLRGSEVRPQTRYHSDQGTCFVVMARARIKVPGRTDILQRIKTVFIEEVLDDDKLQAIRVITRLRLPSPCRYPIPGKPGRPDDTSETWPAPLRAPLPD